ncbi:MAG: YbjN domain-containing protein [Clostridia bacterium]|nr:YbjN domain-containing protein [Clostridia bacterium]
MANMYAAKTAYNAIISMMESDNLKYSKDDNELRIDTGFTTDDIDVSITFFVDAERELVRLFSGLPFKFGEDKRVEGAVATCVANHGMVDGAFDYDFSDGEILFKMADSYRGADFTEENARYLLKVALSTVDNYNDRFFALAKGIMTVADFVAKEG